MGFYSKLAKDFTNLDYDAAELLFRLDDLKDRLGNLDEEAESYDRLSREELRFALPSDLFRMRDIVEAMEIAREDLREKYNLDVRKRKIILLNNVA